MRKAWIVCAAVIAGSSVSLAGANGQELRGCAAKRAAIEREISYAEQYKNTHKLVGLQEALKNVEAHCTDEGLRAERMQKVLKKEQDVRDAEVALSEANVRGKADRVEKKQRELAEAQAELSAARAELDK